MCSAQAEEKIDTHLKRIKNAPAKVWIDCRGGLLILPTVDVACQDKELPVRIRVHNNKGTKDAMFAGEIGRRPDMVKVFLAIRLS